MSLPPSQPVSPSGWNSKLVHFFLQNSRLAILLFISLVAGGIFSFALLHSEGFPSPAINVAVITDVYQGASSAEVERQIVKPLEASLGTIRGIENITSNSRDSFANLQVTFTPGTDFNSAIAELRTKVSSTELPKDAERPEVIIPEIGGNHSYYALVNPDDPAKLRLYGELARQKVEAISGVKEFKLLSTLQDQVEVRWHKEDLQKHGLTLLQVTQALSANNVSLPAGTVDADDYQKTVVTHGTVSSIDEIKNIVVGQDAQTHQPVTLQDIAEVVATIKTDDLYQRVGYRENSSPSLKAQNALIYQLGFKSDADLLKTDKKVQSALNDLRPTLDTYDVKIVSLLDTAESIRQQVDDILGGAIGSPLGNGPLAKAGYLLGGIWLVILAMLVFVSWRAGLISALAIPLSFFFTFLALKIFGTTLNTLTLFSMVLVLGLVVDPAIVVLEAIQREMDLGHRGKDAVIAAINTIGSGVFMAALTSIIVFVPFGVVSGIFGQIIKYIPITVIPALLASYFVPLLFLTFLGQRFLRPSKKAVAGDEEANLWAASRWFIRANRYILHRRWLRSLVFWFLAIIIPFGVIGTLFSTNKIHPVQFSEPNDNEEVAITIEYQPTLVKSEKQDLVTKVEPVLLRQPEIDNYFVSTQGTGSTQLFVTLVPLSERSKLSSEVIDRLNEQIQVFDEPENGIYFKAESLGVGPPQPAFPVSVNIYGDDLDILKNAAIKTGDILRENPSVTRVEDGFTHAQNPQIEVTINLEKIKKYPLSSIQVAQTLASLLGKSKVTKYTQSIAGVDRTVEVILVNNDKINTIADVERSVIAANGTTPILVKDVADVSEVQGFSGINHLNGQRYVTVQAQVKDALKDAAPVQKTIKDFWTADRLSEYSLREDALENKGSGDEFAKSFQNLFIALGVSILLTYIVFVVYFASFSQPLIILFSIPLGLMGVFLALSMIGGQFGFLEILGVITLVGIVENVGIFLIDLANHRRLNGENEIDAISAATGIRLRPIFLTKLTALGGLFPLILISPFWRSLGLVVVAGILTSGILSLFVTPVLYCWFIWISERLKRKKPKPKVI